MMCAEVIWGIFAVLFLLDVLRIRGRIRAVSVLGGDGLEPYSSHGLVVAPGVSLDEKSVRQAYAYVRAHDLDALDLLPSSCSLGLAWSLGCHVDPVAQREGIQRPGDTGGHAFLAPVAVLESLNVTETTPDLATFFSLAREVRRRVDKPYDFAMVPSLEGTPVNPFFDPEVLRIRLGGSIAPVAIGVPVVWVLLIAGLLFAPIAGPVALLCFLLQQPLALMGTGFRIRFGLLQGVFRWVTDLRQWSQLLGASGAIHERIDTLRPEYEQLLSKGTDRFFHPEAKHCPMCAKARLTRRFTVPDLYQDKPGRFSVSRCEDCLHHFQNPQLNSEGLSFYYADFYDGIGEDTMDVIFGATGALYADRIQLVQSVTAPKRWLDVGCGHGHLFSHVRNALPETRLEGLDIGEGVEAGLARGWMDEVHRGFFPEVAPSLKGRFDVVSMCHYLEHTVDPRAEIAAASLVLQEGGCLLIEVPDPQSPFIRLLGRWWMPWFQPQHLHFVRTSQLDALLKEAGFSALEWHTGEANTGNDFALSFYGLVSRLAPKLVVPWRPRRGWMRRVWHVLVWVPGSVFVATGVLLDKVCAPVIRSLPHAGQYRVIARKVSGP